MRNATTTFAEMDRSNSNHPVNVKSDNLNLAGSVAPAFCSPPPLVYPHEQVVRRASIHPQRGHLLNGSIALFDSLNGWRVSRRPPTRGSPRGEQDQRQHTPGKNASGEKKLSGSVGSARISEQVGSARNVLSPRPGSAWQGRGPFRP